MLKTRLLHPEILEALGEAGHGAQVLIADGNYPLRTRSSSTARRVYLNLAPGMVTVSDVLDVLVDSVPIEAADVMTTDSGEEPAIVADFRALLPGMPLQPHASADFYEMARGPDVALAVSTGDERMYANVLLTIGVREPLAPTPGRLPAP
jgi:L-fucose mutarotase